MELTCCADYFFGYLARMLRPFMVEQLPPGFANSGMVMPYVETEVLRQLSSSARKVHNADPCLELYQDGERFWLIDERWGMCQINFMRGQWRSWILPHHSADLLRVIEGAVLWPMAQLLRWRGIYLVPAPAVARDGFGALVLSRISLAADLAALVRSGYRIVGQRWTAIRDEDGRVELLHLPGVVEHAAPTLPRQRNINNSQEWVDLTADCPQVGQYHSFCDAVLMIDATRRCGVQAMELSSSSAEALMSYAWPIADIHPTRRGGHLWQRLAQNCRCLKVQLSHDPADMPQLLDNIRLSQRQAVSQAMVFVTRNESSPSSRRGAA